MVWTILADWLAAACLLIWGVWLADKLLLPEGFGPVLGVSFGMVFLQLAGSVRLLRPGATLLLIGAALLLVRRHKKDWLHYLLQPGVAGVLAGIAVLELAWAVREPRFQTWDEFSHWGMYFKSVFFDHTLIQHGPLSSAHPSYPQGLPALYALTSLLQNSYRERDVLFVTALPLLCAGGALLQTALPTSPRGLWLRRGCAVLAVPLLFWFFTPDTPYLTAYMDAPVGALFAAGLVLVLLPWNERWQRGAAVGLLCAALTTLKEIGAVLALCVLGIWVLQGLVSAARRCLRAVLAAALPFVFVLAEWKWMLRLTGQGDDQFSSMGPGYFVDCWRQARAGTDPYFYEVWAVFWGRVRTAPLLFGWSTFKLGLLCAACSMALGVVLWRQRQRAAALAPACMVLYWPCYLAALFYVYIGGMSPYEAMRAASYERYACCFFIGWLAVLAGALLCACPPLPRAAAAVMLAAAGGCGLLRLPDAVSLPYETWRDEQIAVAAEISDALSQDSGGAAFADSTVWVLSADEEAAYRNMWYYQYELAPAPVANEAQCGQDGVDLGYNIDEHSIRYLALFGADDSFAERYGALADDGLTAARQQPAALYRVERTADGGISLTKMALAF